MQHETVDSLKGVIAELESRVAQLEHRLVHGDNDAKPKAGTESMRMILMGPPGAGAFSLPVQDPAWMLTDCINRQRHPGAEDQGEVLHMSLGKLGVTLASVT